MNWSPFQRAAFESQWKNPLKWVNESRKWYVGDRRLTLHGPIFTSMGVHDQVGFWDTHVIPMTQRYGVELDGSCEAVVRFDLVTNRDEKVGCVLSLARIDKYGAFDCTNWLRGFRFGVLQHQERNCTVTFSVE